MITAHFCFCTCFKNTVNKTISLQLPVKRQLSTFDIVGVLSICCCIKCILSVNEFVYTSVFCCYVGCSPNVQCIKLIFLGVFFCMYTISLLQSSKAIKSFLYLKVQKSNRKKLRVVMI